MKLAGSRTSCGRSEMRSLVNLVCYWAMTKFTYLSVGNVGRAFLGAFLEGNFTPGATYISTNTNNATAANAALRTLSSRQVFLTLSAQYVEQGLWNDRESVCPSVPSIDSSSGVRRVCCWAPRGRDISIDCCTARLQAAAGTTCCRCRRSAANAGSATLTADVGGSTQTCLMWLR